MKESLDYAKVSIAYRSGSRSRKTVSCSEPVTRCDALYAIAEALYGSLRILLSWRGAPALLYVLARTWCSLSESWEDESWELAATTPDFEPLNEAMSNYATAWEKSNDGARMRDNPTLGSASTGPTCS